MNTASTTTVDILPVLYSISVMPSNVIIRSLMIGNCYRYWKRSTTNEIHDHFLMSRPGST